MKIHRVFHILASISLLVAVLLPHGLANAGPGVGESIPFSEHIIAGSLDNPVAVYATNLDGDGDMDVLAAASGSDNITWWENDGSQRFAGRTIGGSFDGAQSVFALDLDGDLDLDVLGAASMADDVTWWENDGSEGFSEHTIDGSFNGAWSVHAGDVDGDGDPDVLATAYYADDIAWWENDGSGNFAVSHTITDTFDGARSVYAVNLDGDGDMDVLGAAYYADTITWWENDGSENFVGHVITSTFDGVESVYAQDVDGDGDTDILGAAYTDAAIAWWENDGSENFTAHIITGSFTRARSVHAEDVDGDGDIDVLGASNLADDITWWENNPSGAPPPADPISWTQHTIDANFDGATWVLATNLDGDGDMDVLGAAETGNDVVWWENDGNESFAGHFVARDFHGARSAGAADMDGDGATDIVAVAYQADDLTWWQNDGAENFYERTVDGSFNGPSSVYLVDLDGANGPDILAAADVADDVAWWQNNADGTFTGHTIDGSFNGARSVQAANLDGDGDIDVLGAAFVADSITWWENDGSESFTSHPITSTFDGAYSVYAANIDGDADVDIVGAATNAGDVVWWENDGGGNLTEHTIDGAFDGAQSVYAGDLNGDGDVDVLGAAYNGDAIVWWENDGSESFSPHTIESNLDGASSVYAGDLDADGDMDVLGTAFIDDDLLWWENDGAGNFVGHTLTGSFDGARAVYAEDVDDDGDLDIVAVAETGGILAWWEQGPVPALTVTSFPFYDGFESGALDAAWRRVTTYEGRVMAQNTHAYSGTYGLSLDDFERNDRDSYAVAVLPIDLGGQTEVKVGFRWREFSTDLDPDDGLFISDDNGATWYPAFSFDQGVGLWHHAVLDLDEAALAQGLTLNDTFRIKLQFLGDGAFDAVASRDGFAFDEIQVRHSLPPTLTWTGEPGFEFDGLDPVSGGPGDAYTYRVRYADHDADPPATVKLYILKGGTNIAGSPFTMACDSGDYTSGVICSHTQVGLAAGLDYSYYMEALDDQGTWSAPTAELPGPHVGTFLGSISGTLGLAGSPYIVTGDLVVEAGKVLTIEPGVELRFAGPHSLVVYGDLVAEGTATAPITFTSYFAPPQPGDWAGIRFSNTGAGCQMRHTRVRYASVGLTLEALDDSSSLVIAHSEIVDSASAGIRISAVASSDDAYATPEILSNTVSGNLDSGIQVIGRGGSADNADGVADPILRNNLIGDNGGHGIDLYGRGGSGVGADGYANGQILDNVITGNAGIGIRAHGYGGIWGCSPTPCIKGEASPDILGNTVADNGDSGIRASGDGRIINYSFFNLGRSAPLLVNNVVSNNGEHGVYALAFDNLDKVSAQIINNTIVSNTAAGIQSTNWVGTSFDIYNNLILSNTIGLAAYENETPEVGCNDLWGNGTSFVNYPPEYGTVTTTNANGDASDFAFNIFMDPQLVDPSLPDPHLQAGSPAIDAACDHENVPATDFDGDSRPQGERYDIGADEYLIPWVEPTLALSKHAEPDPVRPGEALTYTLLVTNTGNIDLQARITDVLPLQVNPAGPLTWGPVHLAPDEVWEETVVVAVEVGYAGTLTNVLQVTTAEGAGGTYTETTRVVEEGDTHIYLPLVLKNF